MSTKMHEISDRRQQKKIGVHQIWVKTIFPPSCNPVKSLIGRDSLLAEFKKMNSIRQRSENRVPSPLRGH